MWNQSHNNIIERITDDYIHTEFVWALPVLILFYSEFPQEGIVVKIYTHTETLCVVQVK